MKYLAIFLFLCLSSCSYDDITNGFSPNEMMPLVTFTRSDTIVKISYSNSHGWEVGSAYDANGNQLSGTFTYAFGSWLDSNNHGRNQFSISISQWATSSDIEFIDPITNFITLKPGIFKSSFSNGSKQFARNVDPIVADNEVEISFLDENATRWSSGYQGNFYSTPSYSEIQPFGNFTISRSVLFGNDSAFVEAKFRVRLYKNVSEYFDVNDGYFRGSFHRKL